MKKNRQHLIEQNSSLITRTRMRMENDLEHLSIQSISPEPWDKIAIDSGPDDPDESIWTCLTDLWHGRNPHVVSRYVLRQNIGNEVVGYFAYTRSGMDEKDPLKAYGIINLGNHTFLETCWSADVNEVNLFKNGLLLGRIDRKSKKWLPEWGYDVYLLDGLFARIKHGFFPDRILWLEREGKQALPVYLYHKLPYLQILKFRFNNWIHKTQINPDVILFSGLHDLNNDDEIIIYFMVSMVFRFFYFESLQTGNRDQGP